MDFNLNKAENLPKNVKENFSLFVNIINKNLHTCWDSIFVLKQKKKSVRTLCGTISSIKLTCDYVFLVFGDEFYCFNAITTLNKLPL